MDRICIFQQCFILFGLAAVIRQSSCQFQPYSPQLEWELRQILFSTYETEQRPEFTISVSASLKLMSLNYLDIKEQAMSITGYLYFTWTDGRLYWFGNMTYISVRFLYSTEQTIWRPPILMENSVKDVDVISRPNVPMRITSEGQVDWTPAGIFTTTCESTVTYWPLDTQVCDIVISSWAYTSMEIILQFVDGEDAVVTTGYQEHGEWELIGKSNDSITTTREEQPFTRLIFTLKFRRRPLFHILNTLFPVILMGFLTVTIFKLSPESGERVGLALTILLAYAVYLSLISDSIPQTSLSASLLSTYLATILLLQTIAVLLTVIYLDIYFTPSEKTVPNYLLSIASFLEKVTSFKCFKKHTKVADKSDAFERHNAFAKIEDFDNKTTADEKSLDKFDVVNDPPKKEYTWKEVALLLDKITLYIYLVVVTVLTISFVSVMVDHYNNSYKSWKGDRL